MNTMVSRWILHITFCFHILSIISHLLYSCGIISFSLFTFFTFTLSIATIPLTLSLWSDPVQLHRLCCYLSNLTYFHFSWNKLTSLLCPLWGHWKDIVWVCVCLWVCVHACVRVCVCLRVRSLLSALCVCPHPLSQIIFSINFDTAGY